MPPVPRSEFRRLNGVALASAVLLALALLAGWVVPLVRQAPSALPMAAVAQAPAASSDAPRNGLSQRRLLASGPNWGELTSAQQRVLRPLEKRWPYMGEVQKSRWMALAGSFDTLPATEQLKLRDRMESWASLSAQQRSQARLNYALTNRMAAKDKWAQWEAYQALSEEQKQALAAKAAAAARPVGAAPALRPVPAKKLARVPAATAGANANNVANLPKIPRPSAQATHHIAAPAPVPAPAAVAVETRPVSMPNVVETAPVNLSTATALPLPALAPLGADSSAINTPSEPLAP